MHLTCIYTRKYNVNIENNMKRPGRDSTHRHTVDTTNTRRLKPLGRPVDVRLTRITHIYSIKHIINADGTMPWVEFLEIKSTGDVTRVANFSTLSTRPVCVDSTY